ncbi:hypothetical protein RDI58_017893 [Solanum bulbocastanum]|uniref:Uncharacterized protein n=1 Tax=Solanum bulbocastanum TaxID=147425 RepID=A0AAN8YCF9_SOLBU
MGCLDCFDGGSKREQRREEEQLASEEARARAAEAAQKRQISSLPYQFVFISYAYTDSSSSHFISLLTALPDLQNKMFAWPELSIVVTGKNNMKNLLQEEQHVHKWQLLPSKQRMRIKENQFLNGRWDEH